MLLVIFWVGTNNGASRYNGYAFENFYQAGAERIGLVNDIIEDQAGTLWLGGKAGLFYFSEGTFHKAEGVGRAHFPT